MALFAVLAAPLAFLALPSSLQTRFETIINPSVGPANAKESADGRLEGLLVGVDLLQRFPLSGCGPGAWKPSTGRELESHNLYGQVMGEMGALGIVTFGFVLLAFWYNIHRIARRYREHPEWSPDFLAHVGKASGFVVILLLLEGVAGHNLFRFSWLWYGAFLIIARHCVETRHAAACGVRAPRTVPRWSVRSIPHWTGQA
jgi:O-antigen ligase